MLEQALQYLERGWSVIPVLPRSKVPAVDWGEFQARRATEEEVRGWFSEGRNLGIVTGAVSGLVVVDVDLGKGGGRSLEWMKQQGLPPTPTVRTQSGGYHFYFAHPGGQVPNRQGLLPGVDIRGDGGFVVAPPSVGEKGQWSWEEGFSPDLLDPPPLPDWLLDLLGTRPSPRPLREDELSRLMEGVPEGQRHEAMLRLMGHFIAKGIARPVLWRVMEAWNQRNRPPLPLEGPDGLRRQFDDMWERWAGEADLGENIAHLKGLDKRERYPLVVELVKALARRGIPRSERLKIRETLKRELGFSKSEFDQVWKEGASSGRPSTPNIILPDPVREEALRLLQDPKLLHYIFRATREVGVVGEEENSLLVYLAMTSRLLPSPISVVVKGESAAGKSWLVTRVAELFPPGIVVDRSHLSAKALFYSDEDLRHKVLYIMEAVGGAPGEYPIRLIQSEGRLVAEVTVRDESGQFTTQRYEREGPTAIITTTTSVELNPENESRQWSLYADDSPAQTRRVKEAVALRHSGRWRPPELGLYRAIQALLRPRRVYIPLELSQWLAERIPDEPVRIRRDFERILSVIEASALLHQYQRGEGEEIEADWRDLYIAQKVMATSFGRTLSNTPEGALKAARALKELQERSGVPGAAFSKWELAEYLGVSDRTVRRWIEHLVASGCVEVVGSRGGRGVATRYILRAEPTLPQFPDVAELGLEGECVNPFTGEYEDLGSIPL